MNYSKFKIQNLRLFSGILSCAFCLSAVFAQSTNQNFPTPVTSNEISGTIKARDLGDARLTSYFYVFNANQGDVFINIVTKNLDGDIDVFTADNLRPLTKIVVYADNADSETGRVIYLRQPQRLMLRVEGRTPNDDAASFRIKFAGSFQALSGVAESEESKSPEVKTDGQDDAEVRVNSVGTIIAVKPKPTPKVKETIVKTERTEPQKREETEVLENKPEETAKKTEAEEKEKKEEKKFDVVITENLPVQDKNQNVTEKEAQTEEEKEAEKKVLEIEKPAEETTAKNEVKPKKTKNTPAVKSEVKPKTSPRKTEKTEKPEPVVEASLLENIRLIVVFKDGAKIERSMSEILRVGVDKGVLTIIFKDGTIGRYSILEVAKMTIE